MYDKKQVLIYQGIIAQQYEYSQIVSIAVLNDKIDIGRENYTEELPCFGNDIQTAFNKNIYNIYNI